MQTDEYDCFLIEGLFLIAKKKEFKKRTVITLKPITKRLIKLYINTEERSNLQTLVEKISNIC